MTPSTLLLSEPDITAAARRLGVDLPCIRAVREVESGGAGFLPDGRPKILFEGHAFWRQLVRRGVDPEMLAAEHPTVVYRKWTIAHYLGGAREHDRLDEALGVSRAACGSDAPALCSASWGLFQIMGSNHQACGFSTVARFVEAMRRHERDHLAAFCAFVESEGLVAHLRAHDWAAFAMRYNGPGYAKNNYDGKLAAAHARWS